MNSVSVTGADADQASAAVLNVNCAGQIAETTRLRRQDRTAVAGLVVELGLNREPPVARVA